MNEQINVNHRLVALCESKNLVYFAKRLRDRDEVGRARYGTSLMTHNGRSAALDAEEELLDLMQYTYQCALECDPESVKRILRFTRTFVSLIESEVPDAKE
jgi:hypothetical protein